MLSIRKFFGLNQDRQSRDLRMTMAILLPLIALSALLFAAFPSQPLAFLPLLGFAAWRFFPQLGSNADQRIFIGFFVFCFLLDDISYSPWGSVLSVTEIAGQVLFRSFGINGMEAFLLAFTAFLLITTRKEEWFQWHRLGLPKLLLIGSAVFLPALVASIWGVTTGGEIKTALIQIRYLYLMPFWVFIGFAVFRDKAYMERFFFWFAAVIVIKSIQGTFVYLTNRSYFVQAEYLYEHYFSAYAVTTMFLLSFYFLKHKALHMRLLNTVCLSIVGFVLILNDRRTSYAAVILALISLFFLLPPSMLKRFGRLLIVTSLGLAFLTAVTWALPVGPGAIYRGLEDKPDQYGPSYRELENANIMREITIAPLMGLGFGKEFEEVYPLPSIAAIYARYKMIPHNTFLSSWCYGGALTIAGLSLYFVFMIATAGRLISADRMQGLRMLGILCLVYFIQYFSFVFGDLGLQVNRLELVGGVLLGASFRLLAQRQMENERW